MRGSCPDRLACRANRRRRLFMVRRAQCLHEPGSSIASWACSSPRQDEQTWCESVPAIFNPQLQNRAFESLTPLV
ncbi:hypothetical protein CgunFtcFv8_020989 [Champsocephalus gunnari]|uniref:Uncharacterized protein n=1 Tax=Champsocephalus gunnari TaxID=52237 RepID=A0AAN8EDI3_CHAGU|nr:hypothetical protein CgunFtcFv8_020989 [Champsocephalus gunnari]